MIDLGPHAAFIIWSYAVTAIAMIGLILWVTLDERHQQALLDDMEARGIKRRSASEQQD